MFYDIQLELAIAAANARARAREARKAAQDEREQH